jgi:hypothetical protein
MKKSILTNYAKYLFSLLFLVAVFTENSINPAHYTLFYGCMAIVLVLLIIVIAIENNLKF